MCHSNIIQKNIQKELPGYAPRIAQSLNQAVMSDISRDELVSFDRVDYLCLSGDKKKTMEEKVCC